ncbi:DUF2306 domain-containing protein [Mammaliicoccus sciuri]|uniref:DUF2306 domain-containing protein n=1 Tax=Mammaliicoccus sciuri TaxID=1296 RepID=UPI000CD17254|nr:DUF2306 domain-containing protein [Mammaliicoccus sciuri]MDT0696865.1 DUF2306 domain-containing protein [Mammaliicoccus sciuri]PNZ25659.1 hypothetical protein CD114_10075 [Mammaliicoccus sciuri]
MSKQNKGWWILFVLSIGIMIPFIYPYLSLDPARSRVEITSISVQYSALVIHIILAFIALVTGFIQFIDYIRRIKPKLHRYIGRIYVISILVSGLLAFVLFFYSENYTKAMAFLVLAILWLFTTWKAYRKAVKRNFREHRIWMIRSFGITLVAVSARLLVPFLLLSYAVFNGFSLPGGRDQMIYEVVNMNIWIGLVLDIVVVEWMILSTQTKKHKDND